MVAADSVTPRGDSGAASTTAASLGQEDDALAAAVSTFPGW